MVLAAHGHAGWVGACHAMAGKIAILAMYLLQASLEQYRNANAICYGNMGALGHWPLYYHGGKYSLRAIHASCAVHFIYIGG